MNHARTAFHTSLRTTAGASAVRRARLKTAGLIAVALAASISTAEAVVVSGGGVVALPTTIGAVIVTEGNTETALFGSGPLSLDTSDHLVSGTVNYAPSSILTAAATVTGSGNASSSVTSEYYFSVIGPANTPVPILIAATASLTLARITPNQASLHVGTPLAVTTIASACYGQIAVNCTGEPFQSGFSVNAPMTVTSDQQDNVQMSLAVEANTLFGGGFPDIQTGWIDPVITIDPTFALASEFQLVFSPGVGNNAPTSEPEPASLALLGAGLAGLGACGRRRRKEYQKLAELHHTICS